MLLGSCCESRRCRDGGGSVTAQVAMTVDAGMSFASFRRFWPAPLTAARSNRS